MRLSPLLIGFWLVHLTGAFAAAQDEPLVTDRPDFTESPISVQPGRVQVESGYTFEERGEVDSQSFGELLVRIGLWDGVELRLATNSYVRESAPAEEASGLENSAIGFKIELSEGSDEPGGRSLASALLIGTTLPTGSTEVREPHLEPAALLALEWPLSERLGIATNLGLIYASEGGEQFLAGTLSVALGVDLGHDFGGYFEYFNFVPESDGPVDRHFVNAGLTYLLSVDFQFDIRAGVELGGETDYFAGVGLAYRF